LGGKVDRGKKDCHRSTETQSGEKKEEERKSSEGKEEIQNEGTKKRSGVKPLLHKGGPPRRAAVTQALLQEVETLLRQVAALLQ
jgi:hypothetical protein